MLSRHAKDTEPDVASAKGPTPIDVKHDGICASIRRVLAKEPHGLLLKTLVARCGGDERRTTIKTRLKLMKDAGHVRQTGERGPYLLTEDAQRRE